jgi:hypothetical protein
MMDGNGDGKDAGCQGDLLRRTIIALMEAVEGTNERSSG